MTTTTTDEALPVPMAPPQGGGDLRERLLSPQDVTMDSELDPQNWTRGEKQEGHCCRDWFFALLFYAHLAAVMTLAILWGFPTLLHPESTLPGNNQTGNLTTISTSSSKTAGDGLVGFLYLLLFLGAGSLVVSSIVLSVMAAFSSVLIQASVLFNVLASILIMVMFAATGNPGGAFGAFVLFALSSCYAFSVWERIPFAAANLTTGVTAIRTNVGVAVVPVTLSVLAWAYTFVWATSLYGALHQFQPQTSCNDAGAQDCNKTIKEVIIGVYLVLFFWTMQVITNVTHVTVAGVVGTWWFAPEEASSVCSKAVCDSFARASFSSFGSICFGSLLAGLAQALHQIVKGLRRERDQDSLLLCLLECLLGIIESLVRYFNKWAYVYVGLYGYSYLESGEKVMTLFDQRGWTAIVNDQLVARVLAWMALLIGGLNGLGGWLLIQAYPSMLGLASPNASSWIAFVTGFLIGAGVSNILMTLISSAVDTVVVCFAEAPEEFSVNYPELSEKMEDAWMATYPEVYTGNPARSASQVAV